MTILWDADPAAGERYRLALGGDVQQLETPGMVGRALQENSGLDLVVIGPDISLDMACDLAESTRLDRPELGVILLRHRLDVTALAQALRSGVREVVPADEFTTLSDAVRHSRELTSRMGGHNGYAGVPEGKVVTVFSAKGGVGKTTFSTNLGAHLASTGLNVLLVDLDLAFGDVGISLQMLPRSTMIDIVAMSGHLDEQGLKSVVTHHDSGLDAVCAPLEPKDADRIPGPVVTELIRVARRAYDLVIVDTPPAFTEHVLAAFDHSDLMVLIATLDIPAIKNLRLTMETLDLLGTPREHRIVVLNRSDAKVGLKAEDVVNAIKQDIAVMVPSSHDVPASVNRGVPIVLDEPRHPVSTALKQLADNHIRVLLGLDADHADEHRRGLGILRGRR